MLNRNSFIFFTLKNSLLFVALFLFFLSFWLYKNFGIISPKQLNVVLRLQILSISNDVIISFIKWSILLPAIILSILNLAEYFCKKKQLIAALLCWLILPIFAIAFSMKVNFYEITKYPNKVVSTNDNIFEAYRKPKLLRHNKLNRHLNVIWIFVESLERGYGSNKILAKLEDATQFMTPLKITPLINKYTIGGILSAKCGAPIYLPSFLNQNSLTSSAFNNAICYDDILRASNYDAFFLVGHDAKFSGLGDYYSKHASAKILDQVYFETLQTPKDNSYGTYSDEVLFQHALQILKSKELKKPYSMNILTLDNHAPNGYPSDYCKKNYGEYIADVIQCNSDLLAKFIIELKQTGVLKDTVLVIMGDHPFMSTFHELPPNRDIFAKIYTPLPGVTVKNTEPSPFDFFPSVLSAAAFHVPREQLGFGYSFFDFPGYPIKDWKQNLSKFESQDPTEAYLKLHD